MTPNLALWPTANPVGTVDRLRILAAAYRYAAIVETVIDRPFDAVWNSIGNIESSVPTFDATVRRLVVTERSGSGVATRATATPFLVPFPVSLSIDLRPGWCLMHSTNYVVCFAAEPQGETATRYAHMESLTTRRIVGQIAQRTIAPLLRRHVRADVSGAQQLIEATESPES